MKRTILGLIFPGLITIIVIFLAWKNYAPGTFLLGWDSIHPEFDFRIAFERAINGVWREEQGVGAVAAHSHMADLPRIIFLWISSLMLPLSFLRYSYIFLCLILGPLGIYFFLKYAFKVGGKEDIFPVPAFLGALYYLLNLGTLQHFNVPFEMFAAVYAFLPWIFYLALKFIKEGGKKNIIFLYLVLVAGTPMAYAATLFYLSFAGILLFLFFYSFLAKDRLLNIKRFFTVCGLVIALNSFWILPNIYSIATQSRIVENSRINTLFSPEAFLRNVDYGTISDTLLHKNFLFSWRAYDFDEQTYKDLLSVWSEYLKTPNVIYFGYFIASVVVIGLIFTLIKRDKIGLSFLPVAVFAIFFLLNTNPPFGNLYQALHQKYSLFREGFRMPFTKASILFMVVSSFYFAYFSEFILQMIGKLRMAKFIISLILIISFLLVPGFITRPAFEGYLINPIVRRELPDQYQELFKWFSDKDSGRTALFPIHTLWGWDYHNWKYEGSGFIQYGIDNPILQRDYDRWSSYNESFYNETSFALYANDEEALLRVLKKYKVRYLVVDESISSGGGDIALLRIPELKNLFSSKFKEISKFGFLTVYDTSFSEVQNYISTPASFVKTDADLNYSEVDPIFKMYGDYIQANGSPRYPFLNLDKRLEVEIKTENDKLVFINKKYGTKVIYQVERIIKESFASDQGFSEGFNCDLKKVGSVEKKRLEKGNFYSAENSGVSCDYFFYPNTKYNQGYVLRIKGRNLQGRSLKVYLQNVETGKMDLEELLPNGPFDEYFAILSKPNLTENKGYTLNVETWSFGNVSSENEIEAIEFYPVDFDYLANIKVGGEPERITNNLKINKVKKYGTWLYKVDVQGDGLIQLGQGYDEGWISPGLEHVKVNSWANGFFVPAIQLFDHSTIYIFFWPQLLEYLGFGILIITFIGILVSREPLIHSTRQTRSGSIASETELLTKEE